MSNEVKPVTINDGIFRNFYAVGTDGTVWCLPRRVTRRGSAPYWTKLIPLKPRVGNEHGHLKVTLYDANGTPHHLWLHIVVATEYCVRAPGQDFVLHGPNGPTDNRASQLRWGTRSDNEKDKAIHRRING